MAWEEKKFFRGKKKLRHFETNYVYYNRLESSDVVVYTKYNGVLQSLYSTVCTANWMTWRKFEYVPLLPLDFVELTHASILICSKLVEDYSPHPPTLPAQLETIFTAFHFSNCISSISSASRQHLLYIEVPNKYNLISSHVGNLFIIKKKFIMR